MATDFFDDDLVREREAALKIKLSDESAAIPRDGHIPSSRDLPSRPVGDLPLTHLAQHQRTVADQVVDKAKELDELRARQAELERERRMLEELREKQQAFEQGIAALKSQLAAGAAGLDKEYAQAERLLPVLDGTRRTFRARLEELQALNADDWDDAHLLEELNRALTLMDGVRGEYQQALADLESVRPGGGGGLPGAESKRRARASATAADDRPFVSWLWAGVAFTLPLMALMVVLAVVWMFMYYFGF